MTQKTLMQNPLPDELYHSRIRPRKPDLRGDYFRDQTAIIHSTPFRRLKHKTQVFFSPQNDHICTRIEHVLHVSTIATTICKGLGIDVELAQAMALGHDLGHAPFGHVGEKVLDTLFRDSGGFIHEVHSLRVVDRLARDGRGLNLTYAVRDGITSHCGEIFLKSMKPGTEPKDLDRITARQEAPLTYEGCVVRFADKIAYLGRDIEDAVSAGLISIKDIPPVLRKNLGSTNGEIIDTLVMDVVARSAGKDIVSFSDARFDLICGLRDFNYEYIYKHPVILRSDGAITELLHQLSGHLIDMFAKYGEEEPYRRSSFLIDRHFRQFYAKRKELYADEKERKRAIVDFLAGMTDSFALEAARDLLFPEPLGI